ncbi:phosphotransferase [Paenibacillaceae bacterium WGS1546]|uniref:phosphotransferase n=1 Tax=Cohnella sp. WGS1546 TaxID=3366810 RepID=UPI00372D32A7
MPFDRLLSRYFGDGAWELSEGLSGWNNTTRFVRSGGRDWVLRIYETHKDAGKIRFEYEILSALNAMALPFQVPKPVRCLRGDTVVRAEDGTGRLACLFEYIEGRRPRTDDAEAAEAFGLATGRLMAALAEAPVALAPIYAPYYELDSAHPRCEPEQVAAFCASPPSEFRELADELAAIGDKLHRVRATLPAYRSLPHQLVHGDLNASNLLTGVEEGDTRIAAILDFEFCTRDLRAMEIAVALSGYMEMGDKAEEMIGRFLQGAGGGLKLEPAEADAVPALMKLRMLDVFLHFLGRHWDGVDDAEVVRAQISSVYRGLGELAAKEETIRTLVHKYLMA